MRAVVLRIHVDWLAIEPQVQRLCADLDVQHELLGEPTGARQTVRFVGPTRDLLTMILRYTEHDLEHARSIWGTHEVIDETKEMR